MKKVEDAQTENYLKRIVATLSSCMHSSLEKREAAALAFSLEGLRLKWALMEVPAIEVVAEVCQSLRLRS